MKSLLFLMLLSLILWAEKIEITADSFEASQTERKTRFIGNVTITKDRDRLSADQLTVLFDAKQKPNAYIAKGAVQFMLHTEDGKIFEGSADNAEFHAKNNRYVLSGQATLKEQGDRNRIYGETVTVDLATGNAKVTGRDDRPVKFTFTTEDN